MTRVEAVDKKSLLLNPVLCECGCGRRPPIAQRTYGSVGHRKGHPIRFVPGHQQRVQQRPRGERNGSWKGGRIVDRDGYILIRLPDHPNARNGYVAEHRLVMEQQIGRLLLPTETVHHINGDRADNRPENLQLRQGEHGSGVALGCLECGSHRVGPVAIGEVLT